MVRCTGAPDEHGAASGTAAKDSDTPAQTLEEMERDRILRTLSDCNGNVSRAAGLPLPPHRKIQNQPLGPWDQEDTSASLYRRIEKFKINL